MSIDSIPCDLFVDISGIDCELPSSKLNEALSVLQPGQTLMAVAARLDLLCDISAFCLRRNLQLTDQGDMDEMRYFLIKK